VSWYSWLQNFWRPTKAQAPPADPYETADLPTGSTAITVQPGASKLLVGVVTTVGKYREINEDNYYVPGFGTLNTAISGSGKVLPEPTSMGEEGGGKRPGKGKGNDNGNGPVQYKGTEALTDADPSPSWPPSEAVAKNDTAAEAKSQFTKPPIPEPSETLEHPTPQATTLTPDGLFIVADGMGGQLAGEQASRIAVEMIPKELSHRLGPEDDDRATQAAIRGAVAAANREVIGQAHIMPEYSNMGTTVVLTLFRKDRAFVAGLGDSRVYRLRQGHLEQLTRDHSLAKALEEAGTISPAEVENHRFQNVLYNYLGCADARDGPEDVRVIDVRQGDKFLMASDGLTGVIRDDVLKDMLTRLGDPQEAAQALVDRALSNDSKDNITCVVIHAV
jgi:serine/threonine protein phosphatase PrpC